MVMKKFWIGTVAAALIVASEAESADLPLKVPPAAPIAIPVVNWSGFYVGGNVGVVTSSLKYSVGIPDANCPAIGGSSECEDFRFSPTSFIGGGQIGFQSQVDHWVFGIEGTWSGLDLHGTQQGILDPTSSRSIKIDEIATVDARFGYAGWQGVLLYAKAGYATARIGFHLVEGSGGSPLGVTGDITNWRSGWTMGAGIEYMAWQNLVVGLEFDYYNFAFDTKSPAFFSDGASTFQIWGTNADVYAVTARLSYLFNWSKTPAVVARY
jgi:outer membrane immunogenic protein